MPEQTRDEPTLAEFPVAMLEALEKHLRKIISEPAVTVSALSSESARLSLARDAGRWSVVADIRAAIKVATEER